MHYARRIAILGVVLSLAACRGSSVEPPPAERLPRIVQSQKNTTSMWGYDPAVKASYLVAQTFTVPKDGLSISTVSFWVAATTGNDIDMEVHRVEDAADPTSGPALATIPLKPIEIEPLRMHTVTFSPPIAASSGLHSFVLRPHMDSSVELGVMNTNPYTGGRGFTFAPGPGRGWRYDTFDLTFEIRFLSA